MSDQPENPFPTSPLESNRAALAEMLAQTELYRTSQEYLDLLAFIARLGHFSPFNALLLRIQKPGLVWAASAYHWATRFERRVKPGSRPLLILWPFAPVALVYDLEDTEGPDLPVAVAQIFRATGTVTEKRMRKWIGLLSGRGFSVDFRDWGPGRAGQVNRKPPDQGTEGNIRYNILINRDHDPNVQFASLAHELGHVFLGHLGKDNDRFITDAHFLPLPRQELEAESVSYLVCRRWGVDSRADTYLVDYTKPGTDVARVDLDRITRAAGQVEAALNIGAKTVFRPVERKKKGIMLIGLETK